MYGMVNKAIEEMICRRHGEPAWERVKARAGVDLEAFISNDDYPDEITYRLVEAAAVVLETPAGDILEAFGRHWVLHTAQEGYGGLLRAAGRDLREFLLNLPDFHTRIGMIFPNLQPPRFHCTDVSEHSLVLHYRTHRPGMGRFVVGLLLGLGEMFGTPVQVRPLRSRDQGADHDVFAVEWRIPSPLAAA